MPGWSRGDRERRGRSSTHQQALACTRARRARSCGRRLRRRRQRQRLQGAHLVHLQRAWRRAQAAADKCAKESGGRYTISFEFLPADADGQREQLVRRLGAEDSSVDLIGMDVIWTGEFANAGWIEPLPAETAEVVSEDVFPSVLETAEFEGELYAAPLWSNTQLLWYRSDLVPNPPTTWAEMIEQAEKLPAGENLIQVQANKYEGLVVWANQMIESAGTSILANPDEVELEEEPTKEALATMGALSRLVGRRPGDHDLRGGPGTARLRVRQLGLHGQLPLRLPERRGERARHLQGDEGGEVPGHLPRHAQRPAARRHQPRRLALSRRTRTSPSRRSSAWSALRTRSRPPSWAGCRRCARTSTTRPRSTKVYPGFAR